MRQFISYAQNHEDVILDAYFKDVAKGTYVDIGANHPVHDSVTKHFYLKGWRGINVEPIASLFAEIVQDRPEDTNLCMGISDKPGTLTLREYANTGLSTFSAELQTEYNKKKQPKTATFTDVKVPVITLKELFTKYPLKHIHFMKVDAEGFEYEVLSGNDWKRNRPEMLCIEANHDIPGKDWRTILQKHHYEKVWNDGLNDYYLAKESMARRDNFSYPQVMLLENQVLPWHVNDRLNEMSQKLSDEQIKHEVQELRFKQLEQEKQEAEKIVSQQRRLKTALKLVVKAVDNVVAARIEHLRAPKVAQAPQLSETGATLAYDASTKQALLASIRNGDMQSYYNFSRPSRPQTYYMYNAVNGAYTFAKRVIRKSLKLVKKAAKRSDNEQK